MIYRKIEKKQTDEFLFVLFVVFIA